MAKSVKAAATKKTGNRRMKRTVRRTIGALCMISAITVAAIPVPENIAYDGVKTSGAQSYASLEVLKTDSNDELTSDSGNVYLTMSSAGYPDSKFKSSGKTYVLRTSGQGVASLDWQFEFKSITEDSATSPATRFKESFITNFNSTDQTKRPVDLSSSLLFSDYVYIEPSSYDDLSTTVAYDPSDDEKSEYYITIPLHIGESKVKPAKVRKLGIEYTLDVDPTTISATDKRRVFFEKYFPALWSSYQADWIDYNSKMADPAVTPKPAAPKAITAKQCDAEGYSTPDEKEAYLCDKIFGNGKDYDISLKESTMAMYDATTGAPLPDKTVSIFCANSGNPEDQLKIDNKFDNTIFYTDNQKYLVTKFIDIIGVAEGALKGVQNITNITLGDQIKYICDEAFCNTNVLTSVSFGGECYVGNRAFYKCTNLVSVDLTGVQEIGKEAFAKTKIDSINIPETVTLVNDGAFYNCGNLQTVTFENRGVSDTSIGIGAFCDIDTLSSVDFGIRKIDKIGDYAFAITNSPPTESLVDFKFPDSINNGSNLGKYTLANRKQLKTVELPSGLRTNNTYNIENGTGDPDIPDTLISGCTNISYMKFPAQDNVENITFDPTMFYDIENKDFYVWGPEYFGSDYSYPRQCTWRARMAVDKNPEQKDDDGNVIEAAGLPVTYKYYKDDNETNPETYEISNGFLIQGIDKTGKLVNCAFVPGLDSSKKSTPLIIPESVAGIPINSIDSQCFEKDTDLRKYINGIVIKDGNNVATIEPNVFKDFDKVTYVDLGNGVHSIGETAFNGCDSLTKVTLGENVESIGAGAFSACPNLIEVHFDTPTDPTALGLDDIGANAFSTGSKQLTFYGEIGSSYGPFKWAMQKDNFVDADEGVRVCYKTNSPSNMTVILDNTNGLATLVDYPHLDQLNDYAAAIGLNLKEDGTVDTSYDLVKKIKENTSALSNKEQALYNAVKYIDIPEGIESIDVKGYIKSPAPAGGNDNRKNVEVYLNPATAKNANGVLEGIKYFPVYEEYGLFNGLYGSTDKTYTYDDPDAYYLGKLGFSNITPGTPQTLKYEGDEKNPYGNDVVETITMQDVKYLPDLAFYNCENLYNLSLGDDMEDVGELPVADCTKLNSIACGNSDFETTNGILYENTGTGKKIVECLPGRGDVVGDKSINKNTDPELTNVSEIAEGAFSNCDTINFVNLEGISDDSIPKYCFYDCDNLSKVTIPAVVGEIEDDAFGEDPGIWLSIANPNLLLSTDAFGNDLDAKDVPTLSVAEDSLVAKMSKKLGKNKVAAIIDNDPTFFVFYYCGRDGAQFGSPDKKKPGECPNGRDLNYRVKKHEELTEYADRHVNYQFAYWMNRKTGELYSNEDLQFLELTKDMMTDGDKIEFEARYDSLEITPSTDVTPDVTTTPGSTTPGSTTPGTTTPGTTPTNKGSSSSSTKYPLTVVYGSGSGQYPEGTKVIIEAIDAPAGKVFDKWVVTGAAASVYSSTSKATTVTTAAGETIITATYKDEKSGSGSSSGGGSGTGTKTSTGTHNRTGADGSPAAGTGSSTRVDITKPGISDVDKAYASVSGSTDSFVVKITESADAANAVATALAQKYGDMTPIKYFAMDISLYDATGTNKITDTTGLKVNVTMPIPDALRQYAGNNKVGAVVNGTQLEDLACKFTTVDGIPCISFTATHFSPYTIYVDTNNLQVGLMDSSPKTGDPIHPKWFVTIALAATSLFLFLKKDKMVIPAKA